MLVGPVPCHYPSVLSYAKNARGDARRRNYALINRHQHGAVPKLGCADNFRANRPIPNFHNLPRGVALRISNDVREMFVSSR